MVLGFERDGAVGEGPGWGGVRVGDVVGVGEQGGRERGRVEGVVVRVGGGRGVEVMVGEGGGEEVEGLGGRLWV